MGIDLDYLLFLQMLRAALGGVLDELFNALSKFAVTILPILPYVVFWGSDKKWGYRYMTTLWSGEVTNSLIKMTVCAYRPWIRSALIEPAGDSKVAATGYSFPSGHTMVATCMYGTTAVWQYAKRRWLSILCGVLILVTGFSRNFLGVHTPQDVIVGLIESVILIAVVGVVSKRISGNEKLIDWLTFAGVPAVILFLVYITQKSYPMDYVNGVLLVDPQVMMNDSFSAAGGFLGFLVGSYIERHYIHYEIPNGSKNLPMLTVVGGTLLYAWKDLFMKATLGLWLGHHLGNFIGMFLMVVFALAVFPLIIRKSVAKEAEQTVEVPLIVREKEPAETKA